MSGLCANIPVVIDCDPGHDDLAAILLAASRPEIEILAITTVCGNAPLHHTTANALQIVSAFGLETRVFAGAAAPLLHRYDFPAAFHGPTGLGSNGLALRDTDRQADIGHAVNQIIKIVEERPGEVTVVVTGPMTNIGLALALRPDIALKIKSIVFMGGSTGAGNATPAAEFNMWADPEAARIVFQSGAKLVMFGLNATHQALLRREDIAAIREAAGENAVADLLEFYCGTYYAFAGQDMPGSPLHDPCPVAYLIDPDIFGVKPLAGEVIVSPGGAYGQTLIDLRKQVSADDNLESNLFVAVSVDQDKFSALILPALIWGARNLTEGKAI